MSITKNMSKVLANTISVVATHVSDTSTKACPLTILQEPKMPKALLKKSAK